VSNLDNMRHNSYSLRITVANGPHLENSFCTSVADPNPFDMDPDLACHFDTDPVPACQYDTDPDV
jgi:hypothetical protein